jgi:hypothetical protein
LVLLLLKALRLDENKVTELHLHFVVNKSTTVEVKTLLDVTTVGSEYRKFAEGLQKFQLTEISTAGDK